MTEIEKHLTLPPPLSPEDEKKFEDFDAAEELRSWAVKAAKRRLHHRTTTDWNSPRRPFVVHPSAVDNPCDFFLYLQIMGEEGEYDNSPSTQMVFDTGTAVHAQIQYYMESRAKNFGYNHASEVGFSPKNNKNAKILKMAGHIDGVSIGWPLTAPLVWEYKTINRKGFEKLTSPHSSYVKQVHLYMLAMGTPVAIIFYLAKDHSQPKPFKVRFEKRVWEPLLTRLLYIRECARTMEDPEKRISSACKRCRFRKPCKPDLSSLGTMPKVRARLPRL